MSIFQTEPCPHCPGRLNSQDLSGEKDQLGRRTVGRRVAGVEEGDLLGLSSPSFSHPP